VENVALPLQMMTQTNAEILNSIVRMHPLARKHVRMPSTQGTVPCNLADYLQYVLKVVHIRQEDSVESSFSPKGQINILGKEAVG